MYHFFVPEGPSGEREFTITGPDVNHIRNVLRMKPGEKVVVSDGQDRDWYCIIAEITKDAVRLRAEAESEAAELPAELVLYQGLPKGDKMEWIIQKAVELGASRIVPVAMKRSVVKLDPKREKNKRARWQAVSESAAKQSGRGRIPEVASVSSLAEASQEAGQLDLVLLPYENARGMEATAEALAALRPGMRIGIFIGPEGGFEETEVEALAQAGARPLSLGRRILRTETAGLAALTLCMTALELAAERQKAESQETGTVDREQEIPWETGDDQQ